jgi:hypothetical protein
VGIPCRYYPWQKHICERCHRTQAIKVGLCPPVWSHPHGTVGDVSRYAWPIPTHSLRRNVTLAFTAKSTFALP